MVINVSQRYQCYQRVFNARKCTLVFRSVSDGVQCFAGFQRPMLSVGIEGFPRVSSGDLGVPRLSKGFQGVPWVSSGFHWFPLGSMGFHGFQRVSMGSQAVPWGVRHIIYYGRVWSYLFVRGHI